MDTTQRSSALISEPAGSPVANSLKTTAIRHHALLAIDQIFRFLRVVRFDLLEKLGLRPTNDHQPPHTIDPHLQTLFAQ